MKKVKKMQGGATYLMKSVACSNTVYFETLPDTKQFLLLAQRHLKNYMRIHEYMLSKDGWVFLASIKSDKQIQKAYALKRKKYNKAPKRLATWKILSEQVRLFISTYVTNYNSNTGREGSLVKRPYERFCFDCKQEAMKMIHRIRRRLVGLQQSKKKYRAKKGHYRIPQKLGNGAIYLSSKRRKRRGGEVKNMLDLSVFQRLRKEVLAKKINEAIIHTKKIHNTPLPDI